MAYRLLASEGHWPGLRPDGVVVDGEGRLTLAPLAQLTSAVSQPIEVAPGLSGPAGVAVDSEGNVYVSEPQQHRILRLDGCGGAAVPLPCIGGPGERPGELNGPRGLAIDPSGRLWVADAGNRRLQVWDLSSGQVVGVIGGGPADVSGSGADVPLREPWDVAVDTAGHVYVADVGTLLLSGNRLDGTVLRLDARGRVDLPFQRRMEANSQRPGSPVSVAIARASAEPGSSDRLLVLDQQPRRLLVYELNGIFDPAATQRWTAIAALSGANAISFLDDRLYVATPGSGTLVFDSAGRLVGTVGDRRGASAGVALDCEGRLIVHPGGGGSIMRAAGAPTFRGCGTFVIGPLEAPGGPAHWQRIRLDLDVPQTPAHFRIYTLTSDRLDGSTPQLTPQPPDCTVSEAVLPLANDPFKHAWIGAPVDMGDLFVLSSPGAFLWIFGVLSGDRRSTPRIRQIRVDNDRPGWISHLPAIYRRDAETRAAVQPFLTLFETAHEDAHQFITDLPVLFDPRAAPDAPEEPGWLDWLASWVGVILEESWTEDRRRAVVATAFRAQATRGTTGYLRRMLELHAGVRARILEGASSSDVWVLGHSPLGRDTRPTAFPAQGAVLDRTATVDHSYLNGSGRYGAELFDESVPCLFVHVYRHELRAADTLDRVRRVLDAEVPAHMVYRLCVIEPRARVGHQASVGIDTIVGGPPRAHVADSGAPASSTFVLRAPRGKRASPDKARVGARIQ